MTEFPTGKLMSRKVIYEGRIVDLIVDTIEIDGTETIREVVRHPGGVVVLGITEDGLIPFVRQHRYPMDQVMLELPAGKIDEGESAETTAAREMEEETGFRPVSIRLISKFYSSPGFCDELLHFYYAPDLVQTEPNRESDEHLEVEFYTLTEALNLAQRGEILDGKTLTALHWLRFTEGEG